MMKNQLFRLMLVVMLFSVVSCSDDDDSRNLTDITTLNMLNEQNGRTTLGNSDVYINKANNFRTNSCVIAELGKSKDIGSAVTPKVGEGLAREVAVVSSHLYQAFDEDAVRSFPSGEWAVAVGAIYYQFYVESLITEGEGTVGATVKFAPVTPPSNELPDYGHLFGEVNWSGDEASIQLPNDAEFFYYSDISEAFDVTTDRGKLTMKLIQAPSYNNYISKGDYNIFVRRGKVYTKIVVRIN